MDPTRALCHPNPNNKYLPTPPPHCSSPDHPRRNLNTCSSFSLRSKRYRPCGVFDTDTGAHHVARAQSADPAATGRGEEEDGAAPSYRGRPHRNLLHAQFLVVRPRVAFARHTHLFPHALEVLWVLLVIGIRALRKPRLARAAPARRKQEQVATARRPRRPVGEGRGGQHRDRRLQRPRARSLRLPLYVVQVFVSISS